MRTLTEKILGGQPEAKTQKIDTYTLKGKLTGAVCQFQLTVATKGDQHPVYGSILSTLVGSTRTKSGFIIFGSDGMSATYAELTDRRMSEPQKLSKIALAAM